MQETAAQPLSELIRRFSDFFPALAAGLLVLLIGVVAGWVAKRAVVQLLTWLRLDRVAGRAGWASALGKGDVRAALYELLGTVTMVVVVLFFLSDGLRRWDLGEGARVIDGFVFYLPNLALVALIAILGTLAAGALSTRLQWGLQQEGFRHARLMARALKASLLILVAALTLWQLQLARQLVLAAFIILFGSAGVAFAIAVGVGSAKGIQRGWEEVFEKTAGTTPDADGRDGHR